MKSTLGRRAFLTASAAGGAGVVLAGSSLAGCFDHRRQAAVVNNVDYAVAMRRIEHLGEDYTGVVSVGHSTHLLIARGQRVLTDPWFYDPAGGTLEHAAGVAVAPEGIGPLDALLLSHDHPEHFDAAALARLDKGARVLVPSRSMAVRVRQLGYSRVDQLEPWQFVGLGRATLHAVPVAHGPALGAVLSVNEPGVRHRSIYFAGATGLGEHLSRVAERLSPTLALLPLSGCHVAAPEAGSMTPEQAVEAARRLGARDVVPTHLGARLRTSLSRLAGELFEPDRAEAFRRIAARRLPGVRCHLLEPGTSLRHG